MDPGFLTNLLLEYRYLILAPGAFVIGPMVSLIAGVLLRIDIISIVPTALALAVGELTADILWYWLGKRHGDQFAKRFGRYVGITDVSVAYTKDLFARHYDFIIFTSKLTAGFGFGAVIMFTAGLSRVPFGRYMMLNIVGQFLWTAGLLSIGYFLGHIYLKVGDALEKIALFALVVIVILSFIGFGRYVRGRLLPPPEHTA